MKNILVILALAAFCTSCGMTPAKEEAITITVDTESVLKGRCINAHVTIENGLDAEIAR